MGDKNREQTMPSFELGIGIAFDNGRKSNARLSRSTVNTVLSVGRAAEI